ncbi:hypothetical protein [Bosea sp. (in: a-proteobacteria)]|uniref:hypothetical protein n=1 Tax=Bosea sp. (in: a-proteobacteria) TaxID=1871050 RepID=UPI002734E3BF|nr:hypothetical protein [Bosea sp. (in: a-proteobacteria)]MDP3258645.1 hypothetical protein [Bosea sp. (in: a-proteobacteria)]
MIRALALIASLVPAAALAQSHPGHSHAGHASAPAQQMGHQHGASTAAPVQPGQGAFAAIQEIVEILEGDPKTDWSTVNIEALRQHLADMSAVTLHSMVKAEPIDGGVMFTVTGTPPVRDAIRRMALAHAGTMNNAAGWQFAAAEIEGGATMAVKVPAADLAKLKGLGFIGVMTRGMHHQDHHLMIARGARPHH